jgi:hypothetical protein
MTLRHRDYMFFKAKEPGFVIYMYTFMVLFNEVNGKIRGRGCNIHSFNPRKL